MNKPVSDGSRIQFFKTRIGKPAEATQPPVWKWLDGVLREAEEGRMVAEFVVREDMVNPMGTLHGGVASMILDEMCGMTVFGLGREFAYTSVNLNCDFLNPARTGEVVTATCEVIRAGKNIAHCACIITGESGKIVAKCTSNLLQIGLKIPV